jgi:ribosomal-protein-alanine N-acetyltransferase
VTEEAGPDPAWLAALHAEAFDAPWDAPAFSALLAQSGVIVLPEDDGFVLVRIVADEAEILTLAVRPAARGRGVGRGLVLAAAATAAERGAARLFLEVADDNAMARALYARAGFAEAGRRAGYYARADGSRRDALLLALNLTESLP